MKKILMVALIFFLVSVVFSQSTDDAEKPAIQKVIQEAYVDGLQNRGDLDKTREGFHPGFNLLGQRNNRLTKFPIYNWIASVENAKMENPNEQRPVTTAKFVNIDVTGKAAVAKLELYRENKHIFTDYLSLYKFDEGWKVVSKIYHRHE